MLSRKEERFRSSLLDWGEDHLREYPWRESCRSLYEVFIAEFFLTQTPADNVAAVYPRFLDRFPSLDAVDDASEEELVQVIEPLGFYNMRAAALKRIAAQYERLPESADELTELPRVGQYVANTTLCVTYDQPLPILDRNVERVYGRVFKEDWHETSTQRLRFAERLVPDDDARTYNLALLDFGALVCQTDPRCSACFASDYCDYYQK